MFTTSCDRELREARDEARRQRERAERLEQERRNDADERHNRYLQSQREAREAREASLHEASDWPDAFYKQATLLKRELLMAENEQANDELDEGQRRWWTNDAAQLKQQIAAVERARSLYVERMNAAQREYERLQAEALRAVADDVAREFPNDGIVEYLRDDDPNGLVNW